MRGTGKHPLTNRRTETPHSRLIPAQDRLRPFRVPLRFLRFALARSEMIAGRAELRPEKVERK